MIRAAVVVVVITWFAPIATVKLMANLNTLYKLFPKIKPIIDLSPAIKGLIEGFIPTAVISGMVILLRTTFEREYQTVTAQIRID